MKIQPLSELVGSKVAACDNPGGLDAVDLAAVQQALKDTGTVYFSGFAATVAEFEAFTNRFSDDYMDNTGSGSYRETSRNARDGTIQNVGYVYGVKKQRTFGLPLHADRAYVKSQPQVIWFLCARPAADEGGLTFVCDGEKIYENLSPAAREVFESQRLKYIRHYPEGQWQVAFHTDDLEQVKAYCDDNELTLFVHDDGSVRTEHVKPGIVNTTRFGERPAFVNSILIQLWQEEALKRDNALVRLEDDSKIPAAVMDEVKRVSEALTLPLEWSAGDFVLVDNTRLMHGRTAFQDPDREVYVRMCRSVAW